MYRFGGGRKKSSSINSYFFNTNVNVHIKDTYTLALVVVVLIKNNLVLFINMMLHYYREILLYIPHQHCPQFMLLVKNQI